MQFAYIVELLYPQVNEICISPRKLSISQRAQIINKRSGNSLRELAKQYGVSYETVRRTIAFGRSRGVKLTPKASKRGRKRVLAFKR